MLSVDERCVMGYASYHRCWRFGSSHLKELHLQHRLSLPRRVLYLGLIGPVQTPANAAHLKPFKPLSFTFHVIKMTVFLFLAVPLLNFASPAG
jgi:hypothetical protein